MAQNQNGHLTIEQLSALLDKQLSAQEEAQSEAHLHDCQQCQGVLNDLRHTVSLLHALPQPTLPRSFVLPPEMLRSAAPSQESATPVTIQIEERRRQRQQRQQGLRTSERSQVRRAILPRTMRVMGTLVALLGFIFLVSAIPFHTGGASSAAGTPSNGAVKPSTTTASPVVKPHTSTGTKQGQGGTSTHTPSATHSGSHVSGQATAQWFDLFNPTMQTGKIIDGLLLLVLALLILLMARGRRVRQT